MRGIFWRIYFGGRRDQIEIADKIMENRWSGSGYTRQHGRGYWKGDVELAVIYEVIVAGDSVGSGNEFYETARDMATDTKSECVLVTKFEADLDFIWGDHGKAS